MNKHERSEISGERSDLQPLRRAVCEFQPHRRGGY
jgi:hypothetical protein